MATGKGGVMAKVHQRKWTTRSGEEKSAWIADYFDAVGSAAAPPQLRGAGFGAQTRAATGSPICILDAAGRGQLRHGGGNLPRREFTLIPLQCRVATKGRDHPRPSCLMSLIVSVITPTIARSRIPAPRPVAYAPDAYRWPSAR
jgi:hypothetical protein